MRKLTSNEHWNWATAKEQLPVRRSHNGLSYGIWKARCLTVNYVVHVEFETSHAVHSDFTVALTKLLQLKSLSTTVSRLQGTFFAVIILLKRRDIRTHCVVGLRIAFSVDSFIQRFHTWFHNPSKSCINWCHSVDDLPSGCSRSTATEMCTVLRVARIVVGRCRRRGVKDQFFLIVYVATNQPYTGRLGCAFGFAWVELYSRRLLLM